MIEGNIDPEYFMDKMQMYELSPILRSFHKRNKESWEQSRFIAYVVAQTNSTKQLSLTDIMKFDWDESKKENTISTEDIDRLKEKAQQYLKAL